MDKLTSGVSAGFHFIRFKTPQEAVRQARITGDGNAVCLNGDFVVAAGLEIDLLSKAGVEIEFLA